MKFAKGSYGSALMSKLKGSKTEKAFQVAGETKFFEYYEKEWPLDPDERAVKQDECFREILGDNLADEIIEKNDVVYGPKIPLHNAYICWGRTQWDVPPKKSNQK